MAMFFKLVPVRKRGLALRLLIVIFTLYLLYEWWGYLNAKEEHIPFKAFVPPPKPVIDIPNNPVKSLDSTNEALEAEIKADEAQIVAGLGENGKAVIFTGNDKILGDTMFKKDAFNSLASDRMSYTRSVPDTRPKECRRVTYDTELPSTSVIIIYCNEAYSALIRTVYSVLNRSPAQFLKEIILVDDFSDRKDLGDKLDYYLKTRFPDKVKLWRAPQRLGLIRARLEGAKRATGDVLVFLDSHCECITGWLEPLLQRIKDERRAVLVPVIEVIDDKTLSYSNWGSGHDFQVGGFTWSGHFTWIGISEQEKQRRGSPINPTRSPTMAGGLFAMETKYFWEMGSYDEQMDVWGGENLEMSFRVWMCGGFLETVPCSHVGHIFRGFHPYTFPGDKDTHGINTVRVVKVWMDDYQRLFYMHRPDLKKVEYGDVSARIELRKKLECKSFQWYLDNVYPEKFIYDRNVQAYGQIRNPASNLCLDTLQRDEDKDYVAGLYSCHTVLSMSQFYSLSNKGELRRDERCADVNSAEVTKLVERKGRGAKKQEVKVQFPECHGERGNQEWTWDKTNLRIIHKVTGWCLDTGDEGSSMTDALVSPCRENAPQQDFTIRKFPDSSREH